MTKNELNAEYTAAFEALNDAARRQDPAGISHAERRLTDAKHALRLLAVSEARDAASVAAVDAMDPNNEYTMEEALDAFEAEVIDAAVERETEKGAEAANAQRAAVRAALAIVREYAKRAGK